MTDEKLTMTETSESEEGKEFLEVEGETESPEESARAVMEALGGLDEETDKPLDGSTSQEAKPVSEISKAASVLAKSRSKKGESQETGQQVAPLQPPQGWDVKSKEWFLKQPREAQEEHLKQYHNVQSYFTKQSQELQREKQEYGQFREALKTKLPEWGLSGISAGQALTELISVQDMLVKDKMKGFEHLLRTTGTTLNELVEHFAGGDSREVYGQPQPENQQLTREEIANIIRAENQAIQQQTAQQREQQTAAAELEQLRQEIGPDGRYKYPELWDAANITQNYWNNATWQRVQPLIEAARKTNPGQRFGDYVRSSLETLRILQGSAGSPSPAQPAQRFSQADELTRIREASVSVRPRGNGAIPTITQAKRGETPAESAAAILEMFNKSH